jgi:hypothetical protein
MAVNAAYVLYVLAAAMFGLGTFLILRHRMFVRSSLRVRGRTVQPRVEDLEGGVYTSRAEYEVAGPSLRDRGARDIELQLVSSPRPGRVGVLQSRSARRGQAGRLVGGLAERAAANECTFEIQRMMMPLP